MTDWLVSAGCRCSDDTSFIISSKDFNATMSQQEELKGQGFTIPCHQCDLDWRQTATPIGTLRVYQ